uniref:ULP_PROTEASE domain-containing protein n=1 Tax=Panagrellus redivivus TaxID=6233 RepID=A0A7E4UY72_PANRE
MAPRRKAAGNRQTADQPEWLKQQLCVVRQYRTAQKQMLEAMRAERIANAKPKKVRRKPKKRLHSTDPAMIRRSKRPRQTSKRVGSPFVAPNYRRMRNAVKVEEAGSQNMDIVKQESDVRPSSGMQIRQKSAISVNLDNATSVSNNMENAEERRQTQRQVGTSLRRSRRQQQPQTPFGDLALRPRRKRKTPCHAGTIENAATPLGSILAHLHIEKALTSVRKDSGTQTSHEKFQQVDAATNCTPPPSNHAIVTTHDASSQTDTNNRHSDDVQITKESGTQTEADITKTKNSTEFATQTHHHPPTTPQQSLIHAPSNLPNEAPLSSTANDHSETETRTEAEATHVTPIQHVEPVQKDAENYGTVTTPVLNLVDETRIIRFTKCTTATPELRIQSKDNATLEHVYSLKICPWSSVAYHCCLECDCSGNHIAFVTLDVTDRDSGKFRILEGGKHGACAQPIQPGLPYQTVRVFENRLFAKADSAFFSGDRAKLIIFRPGGNIYFSLQHSFATYNRYVAKCVCAAPAVVTRSAVWVNYGHVAECPIRRQIENADNNGDIAKNTVLPLKKTIGGKPKGLRVIRPKRSSTVRRHLSATIDEVIESVIHPPAKTTDRAPSVETIEVRQPEARTTMAPADFEQDPITMADINSFDFSPLGSNLSIASSFGDSGIESIGQFSHRASFDSNGTAQPFRRASDPEVGSIGPDVINPMDWLKHRLSLPLEHLTLSSTF